MAMIMIIGRNNQYLVISYFCRNDNFASTQTYDKPNIACSFLVDFEL